MAKKKTSSFHNKVTIYGILGLIIVLLLVLTGFKFLSKMPQHVQGKKIALPAKIGSSRVQGVETTPSGYAYSWCKGDSSTDSNGISQSIADIYPDKSTNSVVMTFTSGDTSSVACSTLDDGQDWASYYIRGGYPVDSPTDCAACITSGVRSAIAELRTECGGVRANGDASDTLVQTYKDGSSTNVSCAQVYGPEYACDTVSNTETVSTFGRCDKVNHVTSYQCDPNNPKNYIVRYSDGTGSNIGLCSGNMVCQIDSQDSLVVPNSTDNCVPQNMAYADRAASPSVCAANQNGFTVYDSKVQLCMTPQEYCQNRGLVLDGAGNCEQPH